MEINQAWCLLQCLALSWSPGYQLEHELLHEQEPLVAPRLQRPCWWTALAYIWTSTGRVEGGKGERILDTIIFELHQSSGRCTSWATSHLATWTACGCGAPTSTPSSAATRTSSPASSTATLTLTSSSSSFQRRRTKRRAQWCRLYTVAYKLYVQAHMYLISFKDVEIDLTNTLMLTCPPPGQQCCLHCTLSDPVSRRQSCVPPI